MMPDRRPGAIGAGAIPAGLMGGRISWVKSDSAFAIVVLLSRIYGTMVILTPRRQLAA
jgi:hypothetical protein